MSVEQMRQWLIDYYKGRRASHQDGSSWIAKVRKMPDNQVFAVYKRLSSGK
jgi:hypothetical protein